MRNILSGAQWAPTLPEETKMLKLSLFGLAVLIVCAIMFRGIASKAQASKQDKVSGAIAMFESKG
jgi:hypothetical protein